VGPAQAAICDLEAVEAGRVRFAELRKRGVGKDLAARTAGSAHGPWRQANSPALAIALPNAYFASLGLPRLTVAR
jgi:RNA-directed DNA polymerase